MLIATLVVACEEQFFTIVASEPVRGSTWEVHKPSFRIKATSPDNLRSWVSLRMQVLFRCTEA
jgi:hypothetical protein